MGYFSSLALGYENDYEDYSYPSPDCQLKWRLEDLYSRLEEIKEGNIPRHLIDEGLRLTDDDIRYAIPEYFVRASDVERAIELAISDMKSKYDIDVDNPCEDELMPEQPLVGQLSLEDVKLIELYSSPLKVA